MEVCGVMELTPGQQEALLRKARKTISDFLKIEPSPEEPDLSDDVFSMKCGIFVTLHRQGSLRGCIGFIISHVPLREAVVEMAMASAFRDPRFMSLNRREYPLIDIEISVLTPPQDVTDVKSIAVGRDGLIISRGGMQGLLLPQVATEQGWGLEEFLTHTCLKAGLPGSAWREKGTRIQRFTAQVFSEKELGLI